MKTNQKKTLIKVDQLTIDFNRNINSSIDETNIAQPTNGKIIRLDTYSLKKEKDFTSVVLSQTKSF